MVSDIAIDFIHEQGPPLRDRSQLQQRQSIPKPVVVKPFNLLLRALLVVLK